MRMFTAHEPGNPTTASPTPYYSLALPGWATQAPGRPPSDSRATLRINAARETLRHMRSVRGAAGR
jgi:hypothetical protein